MQRPVHVVADARRAFLEAHAWPRTLKGWSRDESLAALWRLFAVIFERKAERKACGKPREDSEKEILRQLQEVRAPETKRRVHWRVAGMHGRSHRHC